MQGRNTSEYDRVHIGAMGEKELHEVRSAGLGGNVKRRLPRTTQIGVSAVADQKFHYGQVAPQSGQEHWSRARSGNLTYVRIGTIRDEKLNECRMTTFGSHMYRRTVRGTRDLCRGGCLLTSVKLSIRLTDHATGVSPGNSIARDKLVA